MSFERELQSSFLSKSKEQEREADLWDREQQRRLDNKRVRANELALQAQAVSREKIEPYLDAVNKAIANGKGKLSVPHVSRGSELVMNTVLSWGETDDGWHKEGYKVAFSLDIPNREISWEQNVFDSAGGKMSARLNYEAPDFDLQMKNLIRTIAGNPSHYYYHETRFHKQG